MLRCCVARAHAHLRPALAGVRSPVMPAVVIRNISHQPPRFSIADSVNESVTELVDTSVWPVLATQSLIETIHLQTHIPWLALLPICAISIRIVLLPVLRFSTPHILGLVYVASRLHGQYSILEKTSYSRKDKLIILWQQAKELKKQADVSVLCAFSSTFTHLVAFLTTSLAIRRIALRYPSDIEAGEAIDCGFEAASLPWIESLCATDPYNFLPACYALLLLANASMITGNQGVAFYLRRLVQGMPLLFLWPFTNMPSGVLYYWSSSALTTTAVSLAGAFPAWRQLINANFNPPQTPISAAPRLRELVDAELAYVRDLMAPFNERLAMGADPTLVVKESQKLLEDEKKKGKLQLSLVVRYQPLFQCITVFEESQAIPTLEEHKSMAADFLETNPEARSQLAQLEKDLKEASATAQKILVDNMPKEEGLTFKQVLSQLDARLEDAYNDGTLALPFRVRVNRERDRKAYTFQPVPDAAKVPAALEKRFG